MVAEDTWEKLQKIKKIGNFEASSIWFKYALDKLASKEFFIILPVTSFQFIRFWPTNLMQNLEGFWEFL